MSILLFPLLVMGETPLIVRTFYLNSGPYIVEASFNLEVLDYYSKNTTYFFDDNPFREERKSWSYLVVYDKERKKILFKKAIPLITHVFFSDDYKYIICCSTQTQRNPYDLVVFNIDGELLYKENVASRNNENNTIAWYDPLKPRISYCENKGVLISLSLLDANGNKRTFQIQSQE